ncbi:dihydrofolate reductase [Phyllobacterium salinisoli]|uniref:Dihydrofolate reductase n=1 Tax=Phyllobacterium salinisoli TaxID=1899321 RepID=A0A368K7S5_9HYPH|nr:dihydrofolate reductase [Phyllobacterium salinisoli]RCS25437.1 dihydrofolate reductase [Phyllobacterium salinisoli]
MSTVSPTVSIVVAISENGIIGRENGLPWRLSTDMKRFKAITMGKPIVMGRKTWISIGRPLPGRANIVVTRDPDFAGEGFDVAGSVEDALALAGKRAAEVGANEICVIGGGEIYRQTLKLADRLYVTEVIGEVEGDTHFAPIDPSVWRKVSVEEVPPGEKDSHATRYIVYDRGESQKKG